MSIDDPEYGVAFHGPFVREDAYKLTVDGYRVPYIEAFLVAGTEDMWTLVLDRRIGTEPVSGDEVRRWLPLMADAMAFAAGYPCHGARERRSPFAVRVHGIAFTPEGDAEIIKDDWTLPPTEGADDEHTAQ